MQKGLLREAGYPTRALRFAARASKNPSVGSQSFRIDVLVDDLVVVEVKAVAQLASVDEAILRTYLRFSGKRVGLIINFNVPALPQGIVRRVL